MTSAGRFGGAEVAAPSHSGRSGPARSVLLPAGTTVLIAVVLGLAYLLAPLMGADLSAQFARADFAGAHPLTPIDLRWFGGTQAFGYSLWTPALMSVIGVRTAGVLAEIASVAIFTELVRRCGSHRPIWAGAVAAVTLTANLTEGRITFATSVAFGLGALLLLTPSTGSHSIEQNPAESNPADPDPSNANPSNLHRSAAAVSAVVAGAASPVATLFLLVAAVALFLRRRPADGIALATSALPLIVISGVFADGGRQLFGSNDFIRAAGATAILLILVSARKPLLRIGILVALVMVVAAYVLPTGVGSNATRLSLLFALPMAVAFIERSRWLVPAGVVVLAVVQPPIVFGTLSGAGKPASTAGYYQPLVDELRSRGELQGRVEVPEIIGHWDAVYLARQVPLARGWLRQLDVKLNDDVFYRELPTPSSYRAFLDRNAVQYVAVPDARASFYGRREEALVRTGLPYLNPVWSNTHWTLFQVGDATTVVQAPGVLQRYDAATIALTAPAATDVAIRMRWSDWLTIDGPGGACVRRADDQVVLHTTVAGTYRISSSLTGRGPRC